MSEVKIGKKLIITLTSGMYEDSRFIFREYIQNSADQIDQAIKGKLLTPEQANIIIDIDKANRSIKFFDNATGIESSKVKKILGDVADSEKSGIDTKGFIGIGRLGGLAYCDKLQFSTSYIGEDTKTIMTWDAKKLRDLINDPSVDDDAAHVIQQVFDIHTEIAEVDDHFFEVEMFSVHKSNIALLDIESVREYLSMVAPIPYDCAFYFGNKIKSYMSDHNYPKLSEYRIIINGEQLFKAYRKNIYRVVGISKEVCDEIHDIGFKEIKLANGDVAAWLWFGISKFETQINKLGNIQRGLRLRCKNIQIGDDSTLISKKFFKEDRGTHYFMGEIHIVHPDIKPNSRRDYFVESKVVTEMETLITTYCTEYLHGLYHNANKVKNALKKEIELGELIKKLEEKKESGFASKVEESSLVTQIKATQDEIDKRSKVSCKITDKAATDPTLNSTIIAIEKKYKKANPIFVKNEQPDDEQKNYLTDQLSKLDKGQRRVVKRIFDIIHKVLTPDKADELVKKIVEELKK